jgi:hypothetical protein
VKEKKGKTKNKGDIKDKRIKYTPKGQKSQEVA